MDYIDAKIEFSGSLAWSYEGDANDIEDSIFGQTRTIIRRTTSSYWLLQELAPYIVCHLGSVKILEPKSLKKLISASRTLVTSSHELGAPYFHIFSYYGHAQVILFRQLVKIQKHK